jgi:hypothetical protein
MPIEWPDVDIPDIPGVPFSGDVTGYIVDLLGGFFRTHRPDDSDLPAGTHWLGNAYSNGVIWMYTHNGVWQFPWVGEVISTIDDDFPVANWSFHYQEIMPLCGVSRDGACYFIRAHDYEGGIGDPLWRAMIAERCDSVKVGYDFIAGHVARENHTHTQGVTEERGMTWPDMVNQMQRYAARAKAHGTMGGMRFWEKAVSPEWYDLQRQKVFG